MFLFSLFVIICTYYTLIVHRECKLCYGISIFSCRILFNNNNCSVVSVIRMYIYILKHNRDDDDGCLNDDAAATTILCVCLWNDPEATRPFLLCGWLVRVYVCV